MSTQESVGRSAPCPCGSGKKYKRCCRKSDQPSLSSVKAPDWSQLDAGLEDLELPENFDPNNFDPSQMDPKVMKRLSRAFKRLPKGQLQQMQSMMQKAMAGQDVSKEAEELEGSLPPQFQQMMGKLGDQMPDLPDDAVAALSAAGTDPEMTEEKARAIIEAAKAAGEMSDEEANSLLSEAQGTEKKKKFSNLWKNMMGKK